MLLRKGVEIVADDCLEVAALLTINGCLGGLHVARGAGFHFDETEHVFVPSNEIDLTVVPGGTEVASDHHVPTAAKVEVGFFLSTTTGTEVGRSVFARAMGRESV
jgi:hypothetical protein